MKFKLAIVACLVGMLVFASTASAFYYIGFGQARKLSKVWLRTECERSGPSCYSWRVGHCARVSEQRVDCLGLMKFRADYCYLIIENRVGAQGSGRIHQRRRHTRCYEYSH